MRVIEPCRATLMKALLTSFDHCARPPGAPPDAEGHLGSLSFFRRSKIGDDQEEMMRYGTDKALMKAETHEKHEDTA